MDAVPLRVEEAGHLLDGREAVQGGFNLPQLDAVTHVLDLPVPPGEEGEQAVLIHHCQVAGAVDQVGVVGVPRVLDESGASLVPLAEVPLGQAHAAHADLPRLTWGDWLQGLVQEEHLLVGAGGADGDALMVSKIPLDGIPGAVHSDFRGTIEVDVLDLGQGSPPTVELLGL